MRGAVMDRLPWRRLGPASASAEGATAHERSAREGRRRLDQARRREAAARRRQVAGRLASAALSWSLNAWLEGAMWVCLFGGLLVLYIGSYFDLVATFAAFGYDSHISWLMPLGIDLPVTASVLAQMLAGRWSCHWWVRVRLGLLTAVTAPLTLTGNALRGAIDVHGHFTFQVLLWMDLLAFAVPGLGVVLIGYVASMMQGERAELTKRRLEAEADRETLPSDDEADVRESDEEQRGERAEAERQDERQDERNQQARVPARAEARRLLKRQQGALSRDERQRLAGRLAERTGVSIPHAKRLLREEQHLHVVAEPQQLVAGEREVEP